MYFEALVIHPMKIRLTFTPTSFPRSKHEDILAAEGDPPQYSPTNTLYEHTLLIHTL